jgi:putative ABC transport system substrate-binding protein
MRRREFIGGLAGVAALATGAVAQERVRRIGLLMPSAEGDSETQHRLAVFRQALAALGWTEGKNVRFDLRWAVSEPARVAAAKELIALHPDVIIGASTPVTAALQRESRTTPIVFTQVGDPIGSGFAAGLPNPGGNLTGFTNYEPAMATKWLQLLKEILPDITIVGAVFNPQTHSGQYWHALDTAARSVNVELNRSERPGTRTGDSGPGAATGKRPRRNA